MKLFKKNLIKGLLLITLFSLISKSIHISYPDEFYFDEVYHAYTAQQYLNQNRDAYDPWANSAQKGMAYEWTHPPLAKLLMAGFMGGFGQNSAAWRLGSIVFGSLAVFVLGLLTFEIFESKKIALLSAFLLSIEGLAFSMSRIAMNDSYFLSFLLLTLLYYVKWRKGSKSKFLLVSGIFLGLAVSTKWTAFYIWGILGLDMFIIWILKKKIPNFKLLLQLLISYIILPAIIYFLSYLHYFSFDFTLKNFIELQQQMWWYHTGLKATHSYQSKPLEWVFNLRPVWLHVDYSVVGKTINIYNLGNSAILFFGFISVIFIIYKFLKNPNRTHFFILLGYGTMFLPWLFSPRIMFFYHYLPAVPFLIMSLAYFLDQVMFTHKKLAYFILFICLVNFIYFTPLWYGIPLPSDKLNYWFWLKSWK